MVSARSVSVAAVIASAARGAISLHLADPFLRVSPLHLPLTPLPPLASSPPVSWTFTPQALCSRGFTLASSRLLSLLPVLGHWNTSLFYFLQGLIFCWDRKGSFLHLLFICLLSVPLSLKVLEGRAYNLFPALIPAPSTRPGTQCVFAERRKEDRKGRRKEVEEMKESRREGGVQGWGSPTLPPRLLHTLLFHISVVTFT